MKKVLFLNIFLLTTIFLNAQSKIDSLFELTISGKLNESHALNSLNITYQPLVNNLEKSLKIFDAIYNENYFANDPAKRGEIIEKLALANYLKGNHNKSFELHTEAIELFDKAGDTKRKAEAVANIAYQSKRRNIHFAIEKMREAIHLLKKISDKSSLPSIYNNMGVIFEIGNNKDSAMHYYKIAYKMMEENNDSLSLSHVLKDIAGIYFSSNNISEGLKYFEKSNEIRKAIKDDIGIAWNEITIGELFINMKDYNKAEKHIRNSLSIASEKKYPDLVARNMNLLAQVLNHQKKHDSAYYYKSKFIEINDSIYNAQKQEKILELETIYETEKKSFQIKSLNADNLLKEKEIQNKKSTLYFLIIIVFLFAAGIVFVIRAYHQKKKAAIIIEKQKLEVEKQKELILEKQNEILDSIHYAKRIQDALFASKEYISKLFPNSFIFFNPKDIVSGDFYWVAEKNNLIYLAACDSTGHGVPGAFMSLLNIGFLSEAINEKNISEPAEIFNYVRNRLISSISKEGQKDGFDGILLCINTSNTKVTYAAANNSPVLVRKNELISLEKDRMPVGKGEKNVSFRNFEVDVQKNDILYLYTDGYADQFGGPKGKKFKYKELNTLLLSLSSGKFSEQPDTLVSVFNNWKGNLEQVDDVLVIGIKL